MVTSDDIPLYNYLFSSNVYVYFWGIVFLSYPFSFTFLVSCFVSFFCFVSFWKGKERIGRGGVFGVSTWFLLIGLLSVMAAGVGGYV